MYKKYIEFVKKGFVEEVYGRALSHAKDRREVADYDIGKNISEEEAGSIVEDAERFLVRIKEAINAIQNNRRLMNSLSISIGHLQ